MRDPLTEAEQRVQAQQRRALKAGVPLDDNPSLGTTVSFSRNQWQTIDRALKRVRSVAGNVSTARALELICGDFLGGPYA